MESDQRITNATNAISPIARTGGENRESRARENHNRDYRVGRVGSVGPIYSLTLTPTPSDIPAEIRLRRLLKAALRQYGMRCTSIEQTHVSEKGVALPPCLDRSAADRTAEVRRY